MKKLISVLLAISMVAGMSACSGQSQQASSAQPSSAQPSSQASAAPSGPVTLKFGAQADSTPATQAAVDAFNASQTKYKVEWQQFTNDSGQMHDQLLTSLSSGSSDYDIIEMMS